MRTSKLLHNRCKQSASGMHLNRIDSSIAVVSSSTIVLI